MPCFEKINALPTFGWNKNTSWNNFNKYHESLSNATSHVTHQFHKLVYTSENNCHDWFAVKNVAKRPRLHWIKTLQIAIYFSQNKGRAHWQKEQALQRCDVICYIRHNRNLNHFKSLAPHPWVIVRTCTINSLYTQKGEVSEANRYLVEFVRMTDCLLVWRFKIQDGCYYCSYMHCTPLDVAHFSLQKRQDHKLRSQIWANVTLPAWDRSTIVL